MNVMYPLGWVLLAMNTLFVPVREVRTDGAPDVVRDDCHLVLNKKDMNNLELSGRGVKAKMAACWAQVMNWSGASGCRTCRKDVDGVKPPSAENVNTLEPLPDAWLLIIAPVAAAAPRTHMTSCCKSESSHWKPYRSIMRENSTERRRRRLDK